MTIDRDSILKPSDIRHLNTLNILIDLFQRQMGATKLDPKELRGLLLVNCQIARVHSSIRDSNADNPLGHLPTLKRELIKAADSNERKRLVEFVTKLDGKTTSLNAQAEILTQDSHSLIDDFMKFAKTTIENLKKGSGKADFDDQALKQYADKMKKLDEKVKPLEVEIKLANLECQTATEGISKITGKPLDIPEASATLTKDDSKKLT